MNFVIHTLIPIFWPQWQGFDFYNDNLYDCFHQSMQNNSYPKTLSKTYLKTSGSSVTTIALINNSSSEAFESFFLSFNYKQFNHF